jgi:hypothetical protein
MLHRMALVTTDLSEERSSSIIRVTSIGELVTTQKLTSNQSTLRRNFIFYYVTNRKVAGSRPDEVNDFYQVT